MRRKLVVQNEPKNRQAAKFSYLRQKSYIVIDYNTLHDTSCRVESDSPKGLWWSNARLYRTNQHTETGKTRRRNDTRNIRKGNPEKRPIVQNPKRSQTIQRERVSSDIANAWGSIHLQLAIPFAEEIFNRSKVLFVHRAILFEFRATRAELVSRNAPMDSQRHSGLGTR